MKIAVIGLGYVGITTALFFHHFHYDVIGVDIDSKKITQLCSGKLPIYEPELEALLQKQLTKPSLTFTMDIKQAIKKANILFITVGTPSNKDGSANLSHVKEVAQSIGRYQNGDKIVVVKSTVPVHTCEKVRDWIIQSQTQPYAVEVVSNPEFLREGTALYDAMHPDRIIIGAENAQAAEVVKSLYSSLNAPILITRLRTAELIKYTANAFLALKISYINEIARLCDTLGVDVDEVAEGIGLDQRIGRSFLKAGIGWGGSCFPKDVSSLWHLFKSKQIQSKIIPALVDVNETQVDYYIKQLEKRLHGVNGKTISILGIAFKPNTDDTRDSPAIRVIQKLHRKQALLKVYDPIVFKHHQLSIPATICQTMDEVFNNSDCIFLLTDWNEFIQLDWNAYIHLMRTPFIIDGRNALDGPSLQQMGYMYYGIGK